MNRCVLVMLVLLLCAGRLPGDPPDAVAGVDARDLVKRMLEIQTRVSFRGEARITRFLGQRKFDARMNVFHQAPDKTRFEYPDRDGHVTRVTIMTPDAVMSGFGRDLSHWRRVQRRVEVAPVFPNAELLLRNYRVTAEGIEKVAGFDVVKVLIAADKRPSVVLYLRPENGFRLRRQHLLHSGQVTDDRRYERIEFVEQLDATTFEVPEGANVKELRAPGNMTEPVPVAEQLKAARESLGNRLALPKKLPGGFELSRVRVSRSSNSKRAGHYFAHLVYCDGLATVSVFYRPQRVAKVPPRKPDQGKQAPEDDKKPPAHDAKLPEKQPGKADAKAQGGATIALRGTGKNGGRVTMRMSLRNPRTLTHKGCTVRVQSYPSQTTVTRSEKGVRYTVVGNIPPDELIEVCTSIQVPPEPKDAPAVEANRAKPEDH